MHCTSGAGTQDATMHSRPSRFFCSTGRATSRSLEFCWRSHMPSSNVCSGLQKRLIALVSQVSWESFSYFLMRSEEHTSELQSLMRISYAVFCLKKKTKY